MKISLKSEKHFENMSKRVKFKSNLIFDSWLKLITIQIFLNFFGEYF